MTRKLLLPLAAALLVVAVLGTTVAVGATRTMGVYDDFFSRSATEYRPNITIKKNDTLKWVWRETENPHNVKVTRLGKTYFRSKVKTTGSAKKQFLRTGTFNVLCEVHPAIMRGKVVVKR